MTKKKYPESLAEAQKAYDECLEKRKAFLSEYKDILLRDISLENGQEPLNSQGFAKIKNQLESIRAECQWYYDRLQEWKNAMNENEQNRNIS